ncbi:MULTISPECIES: AMP-binding protein [Sphingobium]|uniref:AMP-binding protein n=1 Tax=Sphingobium TaxID=165695 RepID=UPI00159C1F37|nr:AMP-binding protein [Sphingobium sp. 15-1]
MTMLSIVKGATDRPLIEETIGALLDQAAKQAGEREALVVCDQGVRLSFAELRDQAEAFAAGLFALGIRPGDRIAIWSPNNAEWTITQLAAAKAGLVLVNVNPAYRTSELEHALNKVGCVALITAQHFKSSDYVAMLQIIEPTLGEQPAGRLRLERLPELRTIITIGDARHPGCLPFAEVATLGTAEHRRLVRQAQDAARASDPVNIQFTSGTTGLPKAATLSHRNITNNGYEVGRAAGIGAGDRVCIPVPLYHCFGMVMGNMACLTHQATMVYPSEAFDPGAVLSSIEAERCNFLYGVPTMFIAALGHPEFARFDLSTLRGGIMAGSPCPVEVMREAIERMHMTGITIAYGMTETSPVSFQSDTADTIERRVSTVGRIQPHLESKIIDETGKIVPRGQPGELCTRGYSVMIGYWGDPEQTAAAIDAEGWMHSGDTAILDEEGYCQIVGRSKDMIIRGGENVYPREIEEFLYTHPAIQDVQVIGVPDDHYGEEVCAWIRCHDGASLDEEELRMFCRGRIAHYKIPRHIRFVTDFPMTVTGKIQKFAMRDAMVKELSPTVTK